MIDKSIYNDFKNYLTEGADKIIQSNRDNLEDVIRDSIDIEKSEKIIKKHRKEEDNFTVSPETFLALSLVDDIPSNVDLRFVPEFKLDGVIFKKYRPIGSIITSTKVSYSEKIHNVLRLQINPNSDVEMSRSAKYANNIVNNLQLFNRLYRREMDSHKESIFNRADKLVNQTSPFFDAIISCISNKNRNFKLRVSDHILRSIKNQIEFCSEFTNRINKLKDESDSELTPHKVYETIYTIIIKKVFPKISAKQCKNIIKLALNMKNHIDYNDIEGIISAEYKIHPELCKLLESCKTKIKKANDTREKFIKYDYCFSNEKLKLIMSNKDTISVNSHNFYNLILFISRGREAMEINARKDRYLYPFVHTELIDFCFNIVYLHELKTWIKKDSSNALLKDLRLQFCEYLTNSPLYKKLNNKIDLEFSNFNDNLIERYLKRLYPTIKVYKEFTKEEKNQRRIMDDTTLVYSDEFKALKKENSVVVEFCKNESAWDYSDRNNKLQEITSGIPLYNIENISGENLLKFLFKDQIDANFFHNVQHILFHENLIIVNKDGKLLSLSPSDGYRKFVLKKMGDNTIETSMIEDYDDVQLNRFTNILDTVLRDNSKEHFSNQSGIIFIDDLSRETNIKFIDTVDVTKNGITEQHKLSWGSINKYEQESFKNFLNDFSFIFPQKIAEIHLSAIIPKKRTEIPMDEKELFFYMEKQKDDRVMDTNYFITQEDLILLGRNNRFYTTILIERAFSVIFNREVYAIEDMYIEFKNAIGRKNIDIAERHFKVRGKSVSQNTLLRKIFIQNGLLFMQNKTDQLSKEVINFMISIFNIRKQLA